MDPFWVPRAHRSTKKCSLKPSRHKLTWRIAQLVPSHTHQGPQLSKTIKKLALEDTKKLLNLVTGCEPRKLILCQDVFLSLYFFVWEAQQSFDPFTLCSIVSILGTGQQADFGKVVCLGGTCSTADVLGLGFCLQPYSQSEDAIITNPKHDEVHV